MASLGLSDLTHIESSLLLALTDAQRDRLSEILDRYFIAAQSGIPVDHDALLAANPELAEPLALYLRSCDQVHEMATRFAGGLPGMAEVNAAPHEERKVMGDFELIREIGRGGMGIVYEARQISLDRRVALKMLPFAAVLDGKQIARFKNEAQAAAQLHHPNIVPVFAIGVERGVHYFAMQFIDGQSVDKAIEELRERQGARRTAAPLPGNNGDTTEFIAVSTLRPLLERRSAHSGDHVRTVVALGVDAARALHAAHETGVVHRDVKPSNLLLDGDGKIWIADFGLARCQANASLTRTGEVLGSMRYMSPEQAAGRAALVDHRTDVYSLGATLYEMLALRPAFADEDGPALLRRIEHDEPLELRGLQPKVSVDLQSVVAKAMAKQPAERYATAAELADDLQRVLHGQATLAKPPSAVERLTKWTRRHAKLVSTFSAVSLAASACLAVALILFAQEKSKTETALDQAKHHAIAARATVDDLSKLAERLANVPEAAAIRADMLKQSLKYYQDFVRQSADGDPGVAEAIALTQSRIGDVTRNLGDSEESIAAHRASLRQWTALAENAPNNASYRAGMALAHNNLAQALTGPNAFDEAGRYFATAIELQESLVRDATRDDRLSANLALFYSNRGLLERDAGRIADAETSFRRAIELLEQPAPSATKVDQLETYRGLAAAYNNLCALYLHDNAERAIVLLTSALEKYQQGLSLAPHDAALLSEQATAYNNLGAAQTECKRLAAAVDAYDAAIRIQRRLTKLIPDAARYRGELAVSFNNLGMAHWQLGNLADADAHSDRLELQQALTVAAPQDVELQSRLGGMHNNRGMALERSDRQEEAVKAYRQAAEHQLAAFQAAPRVERYRAFLSKTYGNLGRALRALRHGDEAIEVALQRRELWPGQSDRLFAVAEELALAMPCLDDDSKTSAETCAQLTIETLQQAAMAGRPLPRDLDRRESFAALQPYPEFQALVKP